MEVSGEHMAGNSEVCLGDGSAVCCEGYLGGSSGAGMRGRLADVKAGGWKSIPARRDRSAQLRMVSRERERRLAVAGVGALGRIL